MLRACRRSGHSCWSTQLRMLLACAGSAPACCPGCASWSPSGSLRAGPGPGECGRLAATETRMSMRAAGCL